VTFQHHIESEHNVWNYLYFIVHLLTKDTTEFTGPESYVYDKILPYMHVSLEGVGLGGGEVLIFKTPPYFAFFFFFH